MVAYSVDGLAGEGVFDVAALAAAGVRHGRGGGFVWRAM